jgi:hypothetical protein
MFLESMTSIYLHYHSDTEAFQTHCLFDLCVEIGSISHGSKASSAQPAHTSCFASTSVNHAWKDSSRLRY